MNDPIRRGLGDGDACSNSSVASFDDGEASITAMLVVCNDSNVLRGGDEGKACSVQQQQRAQVRLRHKAQARLRGRRR
ncbi:hypothetical protein WN944_023096 [Citrus x changshan-huyou]|uniref:Uncharacterized protein n=1 Tax=Citrus x changshan-huyou TaxID=2935761 RepID=A0AAP0R0W4_9ROSI